MNWRTTWPIITLCQSKTRIFEWMPIWLGYRHPLENMRLALTWCDGRPSCPPLNRTTPSTIERIRQDSLLRNPPSMNPYPLKFSYFPAHSFSHTHYAIATPLSLIAQDKGLWYRYQYKYHCAYICIPFLTIQDFGTHDKGGTGWALQAAITGHWWETYCSGWVNPNLHIAPH